jgi:hypothetical protein
LAAFQGLFGAGTTSPAYDSLRFTDTDTLQFFTGGAVTVTLATSAVFRDPSAWYHVVLALDTTQATNTNRVKLYVNNIQQTLTGTYPNQNTDWNINNTITHSIGAIYVTSPSLYFNGYMTEINFIDGQALTPSSFGLNNPDTGVWSPKQYKGTYGTNGFYLNFSDNSNNTAATLGKDYSGNGNNWTPNLFIVSPTTSVNNDSMVDSPTAYGTDTGAGGEVRGNYCIFNAIETNFGTLSNGNLNASLAVTSTTGRQARGTFLFPSSGKFYFEVSPSTLGVAGQIGIAKFSAPTNGGLGITPAFSANDIFVYLSNGQKQNGVTATSYGALFTTSNVIGVAFDCDFGELYFYKDGVSQGFAYGGILNPNNYYPVVHAAGANGTFACDINFGQRPFTYTAPSGYKALVTTNLPTPTIGATSTTQANDYFDAVTYTGNGSTQSITSVGFQPDFVWIKSRSSSGTHSLSDSVRGVNKQLFTNLTDAEGSQTDQLTAFNSNGFSLGANVAGTGSVNVNTVTYVAWNWRASSSNQTISPGQYDSGPPAVPAISSTIRVNTTSGFSIVTYTGNGFVDTTVAHGIGIPPSLIIIKRRNSTGNWAVFGNLLGANKYLLLNSTAATATGSPGYDYGIVPGNMDFTLASQTDVNASGGTYVAYCFAPVAGYSAFGSYTGNGSTDGPFVFTGFRPRYILVKRTDSADNWAVYDSARDTYNQSSKQLRPDAATAELDPAGSPAVYYDLLSNGFKNRGSNSQCNASGGTYIYMAFAESPFKYALAR